MKLVFNRRHFRELSEQARPAAGAASSTWAGWVLTRSCAEGSSGSSVSLLRDWTGRDRTDIDHVGGRGRGEQRHPQLMEGMATETSDNLDLPLFCATLSSVDVDVD